jgi:hypothetical protein
MPNSSKGLGATRAKIGPISDVDNIFSKMYSQYVLFKKKNGKNDVQCFSLPEFVDPL